MPAEISVWSESSLCAQWAAKDPSFLQVDSEDSDQPGRIPRLIWVFAGHTCHFVGFVTRWLILLCLRAGYCKTYKMACASSETPIGPLMHTVCSEFLLSVWSSLELFAIYSIYSKDSVRQHLCAVWSVFNILAYMSRDMTKPTKWVCAQRRLRSAWASAQSDQSLHCALSG